MTSLTCPTCLTMLSTAPADELTCVGCGCKYPVLDSVPFVYPQPAEQLADWRNRYNRELAELEHLADSAKLQTASSESTQSRLDQHERGLRDQIEQLQGIAAPLAIGDPRARETHIAVATQLPGHHGLLSYAQNIFRDWCWGDEENQLTTDHLLKTLAQHKLPNAPSILVLGAGAGRLAYDMHQALGAGQTIALDSNPLLSLIGSQVSQGNTLELIEFPLAPIEPTDCAIRRTLSAPNQVEGLQFVCADALNPPFGNASFDLVITPWLIDVIDAPLSTLAKIVASLLSPRGQWLIHGSLAFEGALGARFGSQEVKQITQEAGFDVHQICNESLPYLQSPASRAHRRELTFTQLAKLANNAATFKTKGGRPAPHRQSPAWLVDTSTAVPLSEEFRSQILATRVHAFVMSLLDGERSIDEVAKELETQRLMPQDQARAAIRELLRKMHEEARASKGQASAD